MANYELQDRIGEGAYGEVFRARLVGTDEFSRTVAVKRVHKRLSHDERIAARLAQEARIASKLQHPNIISVLDLFHDEAQRLCLATELVHGVPLSVLMRSGPIPLAVVIYVVTEILRGLGHVHAPPRELVHRDVAPKNILVAWNGAVKLADFGIAKAQAETGPGDRDFRGTPGYISPEHIDAMRLDGRADLFAVGVILYELLTGRRPFRGENTVQTLVTTAIGAFERPRDIRPEIPEELEAIATRLLAHDRDGRHAGAAAAIADLLACEHASAGARDALVALLAERFPSASPHADPGPAQSSASRPGRGSHAGPPEPRERAPHRATKEWRPDEVEWPSDPLLDAQHSLQQLEAHMQQLRAQVQQLQAHMLGAEKKAEPRRGWLAALVAGLAVAVALLIVGSMSSHTRRESGVAETDARRNAAGEDNAAEKDKTAATERRSDAEDIMEGREQDTAPVDGVEAPAIPAVESRRSRRRSSGGSWERMTARDARGSRAWRP